MKKHLVSCLTVFALIFVASLSGSAQLRLPRPSQSASVSQTIGVTDITIKYSRPGVKDRAVFGEWPTNSKGEATLDNQNERPKGAVLVPFGHIWRTGANEATQFVVTDDVTINGEKLAAGDYSLHTIPGKNEWTIVFNDNANQWGSFNYDPSKDTLRVKVKPEWVADSQEWLGFTIDPSSDNSATVTIKWEKVRVPFIVGVDVAKTTLAKAAIAVAAAKAGDWRTPLNAAGFADKNGDKASAAKWSEQALKTIDDSIATKPSFQNYSNRFTALMAMGRKAEAIAAGDKALEVGKAEKADTAAFEKSLAAAKVKKN